MALSTTAASVMCSISWMNTGRKDTRRFPVVPRLHRVMSTQVGRQTAALDLGGPLQAFGRSSRVVTVTVFLVTERR